MKKMYYSKELKEKCVYLFKRSGFLLNLLVSISSIIAGVAAIFLFCNIGNINEWNQYIKTKPNSNMAVARWKEDLSKIRIDCSEQYVEEVLGIPLISEEIVFENNIYKKKIYINSYFTLICVYQEDSALVGYLVIGNTEDFDFQNYRCGFSLFEYTINEAEQYCYDQGVQSIILLKGFSSPRLDCNSYYFECNYQHAAGATVPFYIGYGVCDIGALESKAEFYEAVDGMYQSAYEGEEALVSREKSEGDAIRDLPINAFLVIKDFSIKITNFINEYLISNALGMSRDEYSNMQSDYVESIDSFLE